MQGALAVVVDAFIVEALQKLKALFGSDKINLLDTRIRSGRDHTKQALVVIVQAVDRRFMVQIRSKLVVDPEFALMLHGIEPKVEARNFGKGFERG